MSDEPDRDGTTPPPVAVGSYAATLEAPGGKRQLFEEAVLDHVHDQRERWVELQAWLQRYVDENKAWQRAFARQLRSLHDSKADLERKVTDVEDTLLVGASTGGDELASARDVALVGAGAGGMSPPPSLSRGIRDLTPFQVAMIVLVAIVVNNAVLILVMMATRR